MMAGNQKAVSIRFNMDDRADRELYQKLVDGSGSAASLTAYVKRVLEEHLSLDIRIAEGQEFHDQMLAAVREEMQSQGMKLVGALLTGLGTANTPVPQTGNISRGAELPEACDVLPRELQGILDFIG